MSDNNTGTLLANGVADAVGFVGGALLGFWAGQWLGVAMKTFYDVRNLPGLKKKPSTSELIDWLKLLVAEDIPLSALQSADNKVAVPPLVGALLKNEQDVSLFEKLVFMNQRNR